MLNDLKIRKVKSQISKVSITLQTYIEGINADVLIGRVIDGKYKIDKYLGRGGYGKVYTVLDIFDNNNMYEAINKNYLCIQSFKTPFVMSFKKSNKVDKEKQQ